MEYEEGQLIVYKNGDRFEIGRIKRIKEYNQAYIWFTSGDTATLTSLNMCFPIANDYCIKDLLDKEVEVPILEKETYGEYVEIKYKCPSCDTKVYRGDNYCSTCGAKIDWSE